MSISKSEWEIMRVIWTKDAATSGQILDILGEKIAGQPQRLRLLKRLVDKGYLTRKRSGKAFLYSSLLSEQEAMNQQADDLFDKFCQRKHKTILEHLLKETPMTLSDIADLQALLSSKEKKLWMKYRVIVFLDNVVVKNTLVFNG